MRWRQKALIYRALGVAPGGARVRYLAQRYLTRSIPRPHGKIPAYNRNFVAHRDAIRRHGGTAGGLLFEFGAGWDLCQAIALWCFGMEKQLVVDLHALARPELIDHVITYYRDHGIEGGARRPPELVGRKMRQRLQCCYGIEYRAPQDAASMWLPDDSVDLVVSTNTLEHIPQGDIQRIMRECHRLCRRGAILSLKIDYQDHWSYSDRSIGVYNFLRFDDDSWELWNPPLHYQNRMRHSDYRFLFRAAGFEVLEETATIPPGGAELVRTVPLAKRWRSYAPEDLAAINGRFVLTPAY